MEERLKGLLCDTFYQRNKEYSKADFGRTLIIGGSKNYPNAPVIAAKAALRTGCGYVAFMQFPEILANPLPDEVIFENFASWQTLDDNGLAKKLNKYSSIVFGNGIANDEKTGDLLLKILQLFDGDLIIDATGLDLLKNRGWAMLTSPDIAPRIIVTPHFAEYAKLFNRPYRKDKLASFVKEVRAAAEKYNLTILLKGPEALIANPGDFVIVEGQEPSLARAGTGDALAGLIGGFCACVNLSPKDVGAMAYALLVETARIMDAKLVGGTYTITEVLAQIPPALREILGDK